jgi:hypothetical protein
MKKLPCGFANLKPLLTLFFAFWLFAGSGCSKDDKNSSLGNNASEGGTAHLTGSIVWGQSLFMFGSTWLQRHIEAGDLYVTAILPDWDYANSNTIKGFREQRTFPVRSVDASGIWPISQWRIDGLEDRTVYIVYLFTDKNGNGISDYGNNAEGPRLTPYRNLLDQLYTAPRNNISLTYAPVVPPVD